MEVRVNRNRVNGGDSTGNIRNIQVFEIKRSEPGIYAVTKIFT